MGGRAVINPIRFPISRHDLSAIAGASRRLAALRRAGKLQSVPPATGWWANDSITAWDCASNGNALSGSSGSSTPHGWSFGDEATFILDYPWWVVMHANVYVTIDWTYYLSVPFYHNIRLLGASGASVLEHSLRFHIGSTPVGFWMGSGNRGEPNVSVGSYENTFEGSPPPKSPGHGRCLTVMPLDAGTYTFGSYFYTASTVTAASGNEARRGTVRLRRGAIAGLRPA
jgi:hypothetical protein